MYIYSQSITKIEEPSKDDEDTNVDVDNDDELDADNVTLDKQLTNMISGKLCLPSATQNSVVNRAIINAIANKIQSLKIQYNSIIKLAKDYQCYGQSCVVGTLNQNTFSSPNNCSCYSPLCLQRIRLRKELFLLLRKANLQFNNNSTSLVKSPNSTSVSGSGSSVGVSGGLIPIKKTSILEQKLTAPKSLPVQNTNPASTDAIKKNLETAVACATKFDDDLKNVFVPMKLNCEQVKQEEEIKEEIEIKEEDEQNISSEINVTDDCINSPPTKKIKTDPENTEEMTPDAIKEMIVGSSSSKTSEKKSNLVITTTTTTNQVTTTTTTQQTVKIVDGVVQSVHSSGKCKTTETAVSTTINGSGRTIQTLNAKSSASTYSAQQNRRFCLKTVKREEKVFKAEHAEDGSERVYSTVSSEGKVYLKKVQVTLIDRKKKRIPVKYPLCSTFQTKKGIRSLMVLPQHEIRKLARHAGRVSVNGFHAMAKPNNSVWPYPCSRPLFKTCWLYRTVNLKSLAAAAIQLRILWSCLRWDDMQIKPITTDGKHQITTDTDIITMELLKHRHQGRFLERTQYLRRKIIIPLELPKTVRGMFI